MSNGSKKGKCFFHKKSNHPIKDCNTKIGEKGEASQSK
jgi:hypothetical protein